MHTKEQLMTILILILISVIAIVATIVEVRRDGYGRVSADRA
jgi:hypothetical protein